MELSLTQSQSIIARDKHRFRVVCCGRRFGKTTLSIFEMLALGAQGGKRIAYLANTYQQARDIAWEGLKKELILAGVNTNESRLELRFKGTNGKESLILLRGWESVDTLRGQAFDFLVIDEVASMRNFDTNWQEVIRPTLTDTRGECLFISTPKGFNHFYDLFNQDHIDPDFKSFHFTSYDNPHLPIEEIDKAKKELTEDRFAQEYMADFRKTEGLVYKEFDRQKHLYTDNPHEVMYDVYERVGGVDFGYTNPTAVISIVKDTRNEYWVTDEWYKVNKTDSEVADYVASCRFNKVYPDPESPSAIEELRRRGVNIRDVIKNKDSIKNGIQTVRELLKSNRLHISRTCLNLISEFETYSYPDKSDGKNEQEVPIKEHDHALDALRYALMTSETSQPNQKATVSYAGVKRYGTNYGRGINNVL